MNKKTGVILLIILILTGVLGYYTYTNFFVKKAKEEVKEVSKIDNYGYTLYDNQSKEYKKMFEELNTVLLKEEIDYNKYVELISKMFIIDFYTLDNKLTNLNIGGVDFVHSSIVSNFSVSFLFSSLNALLAASSISTVKYTLNELGTAYQPSLASITNSS